MGLSDIGIYLDPLLSTHWHWSLECTIIIIRTLQSTNIRKHQLATTKYDFVLFTLSEVDNVN